jgi:spermidine/putrescine transport system substrate-binding protein
MTTTQLTRSDLLRRAAVGGAALAAPGVFTALARAAGPDPSKLRGKTMVFSNWPLYIDVKAHRHPSLDQFARKYGVKVRYIEDINDNASFFGKIQAQLRRGQSIGRDLIVMTDNSPYPALLVKNKWVEKIDKSVVPNIKNLVPGLRHPSWDPNRDYSMPWVSGLDGIGYNAKLTKPVTTVDQLFTDRRLKGKVTLLNEMADSMTLVMLSNGDDPGKVTDASFNRALAKIQRAVKSGQIRQFTGNDYSGLMAKGDVWAAFVWSGDMVQLHADNKNLRFVIPKSGGGIWTDNMLIPKHGDAYLASVYMNFVYDPRIAAEIDDYINYICPVLGARQVLLRTDPAAARNPLIFPTPATLKQLHQFDPNALFNPDYKAKWQKLLGA